VSETPLAAPELPPDPDQDLSSNGRANLSSLIRNQPPWLIAGVLIALVAVIVLAILAFWPDSQTAEGEKTPEATLALEYVLPPGDSLLTVSGTPVPQSSVPISLTVKGITFDVLPSRVQEEGELRYPAGESGTAVWVYGTIVNLVMGIEQTKANNALVESLAAGDEITMTTSSGVVYRFGYTAREALDMTNPDLFSQHRPSLTLITLGGKSENRVVVHSTYLGMKEGVEEASQPVVSVGEPAQLGDVRLTVLGTSYVYEGEQVPKGWAFYLVEFQIENFSQQVLDPNRFRMQLQDGAGNTYSVNLPASQAGTFGYLMLTIPPNTVAQGTAGYLVPVPLQGPALSWAFSRLDAPENVVQVRIDFQSPHETIDPRQLTVVTLMGAEISGDRTLLSVWGIVANNSEEPISVRNEDVTLLGGENSMALRAADPAFPWSIQPGSNVSFRVAFQRPVTPVAIFTILGQPFELRGLQ
jgi:hypothetical protein